MSKNELSHYGSVVTITFQELSLARKVSYSLAQRVTLKNNSPNMKYITPNKKEMKKNTPRQIEH